MEYAPEDVDQRRLVLRLQSSTLDWTIVRPNWFHQNVRGRSAISPSRARERCGSRSPAALSFVDTRDIAAVVTEALVAERHAM